MEFASVAEPHLIEAHGHCRKAALLESSDELRWRRRLVELHVRKAIHEPIDCGDHLLFGHVHAETLMWSEPKAEAKN